MHAELPSPGLTIGAGELFRSHASFIAGFLVRLGAPASELDDMVQEVFVVAHRRGGYVAGPAQPRSWLAAIALRVAQARRRARATQQAREAPLDESLEELGNDGRDPGQRLEIKRLVELVQRALDTLTIEARAAFTLYELEGESCESIAAVLNVPVGTVYSRLHNARRRFMQAFSELSGQEATAPAQRVAGAK